MLTGLKDIVKAKTVRARKNVIERTDRRLAYVYNDSITLIMIIIIK